MTAVNREVEARADEEVIQPMVDIRMKRQEVLKREPPPHVWAIVDEAVVRRRVDGPAVMTDKLQLLRKRSRSPHVTLQVLPIDAGAHAAQSTGFNIIRGPEPSLDVVHMSSLSGALYLEKETELERHKAVFEYLRSQALSTSDTTRLLGTLAKEF
ncbi:DUF5753 domain-containing protein [Streptomyces sp. AS02]|nr:DUF5753 domain-containing protein [Streptomyces sp. AS02]